MRHDLDIEADIAARLENLLALILGFNLELSAGELIMAVKREFLFDGDAVTDAFSSEKNS